MEDLEYNFVKKNILSLTGIDLNGYKTPQMQRRLATYLQRSGHTNWRSYFEAIRLDRAAISKLKDYLTINVTSFFRDSEKFDYLRRTILPTLSQSRLAPLRIWSAGCSLCADPYSLAMILKDLTPGTKHRILATDLDVEILAKAKMGMYSSNEFKNISQHRAQKHFQVRDGKYLVSEDIKNCVEFKRHNLLLKKKKKGFDLILCRNVVIYFTDEAKFELYKRFFDALKPGGVLFVGGTEAILNFREIGFESYLPFFYRKPL